FRTAPDALEANWERVNPFQGLRRMFSVRTAGPAAVSLLKVGLFLGLSSNGIAPIVRDPIFYSAVDVPRIGAFLADASLQLVLRLGFALVVLASGDYGYQLWRTNKDPMITREEVKEEMKHQEGDPKMKARQRTRRRQISQRKMMAEVPKA